MTHAKPRIRRAFTLIELLVVVAVVALLVSLLLPGLRSARESARSIACQSNLRQLGIGLHAYANDFRGFAAPACADALRNLSRWHGSRGGTAEPFTPSGGALSAYIGEEGGTGAADATARWCPTFAPILRVLADARRGFERNCGGYGYNARFLGTLVRRDPDGLWRPASDRSGSSLAKFQRPHEKMAFADGALIDPDGPGGVIEYSFIEPRWWPDNPDQRPDPSIHFRHGARAGQPGIAHAAMLDGHVSAMKRDLFWTSGIYGEPTADPLTGWPGAADSNAMYDFE